MKSIKDPIIDKSKIRQAGYLEISTLYWIKRQHQKQIRQQKNKGGKPKSR